MKKYVLAAMMLAAVCVSANAKKEKKEILFGVKSGIITISSDMGNMPDFSAMASEFAGMGNMENMPDFMNFDMSDMSEKIYFDDYGRKTARVTKTSSRTTRTIEIGDTTYTINEDKNTATAMPIFGGRGGRGFGGMGMGMMTLGEIGTIDWLNLDKKTIRRNKIQELGEETIAGVTCKKYSMATSNTMGFSSKMEICVYKGILLSNKTESDWSTTTQTAVGFEENADIPASMFELPEGCEVEQMNFGGMGGFGGGMGGFGGDFGGFGGDFGGFGGGMMF